MSSWVLVCDIPYQIGVILSDFSQTVIRVKVVEFSVAEIKVCNDTI